MGGDAFKDIEIKRLSTQEFYQIKSQIIFLLKQYAIKLEAYIPMPQKQSHGDIDFVIILKQQIPKLLIPQTLKSLKHISKNTQMNCQYKKHQVDFNFVKTIQEYEMDYFYNIYGGIGAILCFSTHRYNLKLTKKGLFLLEKLNQSFNAQFLISGNVKQILKFYGLDQQIFAGFTTQKSLFQYLIKAKRIYVNVFRKCSCKDRCKILNEFINFCKNGEQQDEQIMDNEQMRNLILEEFNLKQKYQIFIKKYQQQLEFNKIIKQKFNGGDILNLNVKKNQVQTYKRQFKNYFQSQQQYNHFILNNSKQVILEFFKTNILNQLH